MKKITLEDALKKIKKLEEENAKLKEELEYYKNRKIGGRKKHDEQWMQGYNDFVVLYEGGKTIMEIVETGLCSRRTAYRYKSYYDELNMSKKGYK